MPGHFHQNLTMTHIKYQQKIGETKGEEEWPLSHTGNTQ